MQRPDMSRVTAALRWGIAAVVVLTFLPNCGFISNVTAVSHCPPGFLSCYYGECLRQSKFCDGHQDCVDNSDEKDCDSPCHHPDYFRCRNGKCIAHVFLCDGEDECGDGSDEQDCSDAVPRVEQCTPDEFRCGDNLCIPADWKCDGSEDCLDGSDETTGCIEGHCEDKGSFLCANHHCIPIEWRCDTQDDCLDNSDEIGCQKLETSTCPIDRGLYPCANHVDCAELTELCNGVKDCPDGSDEGSKCTESSSKCSTYGCSHKCIPTPDGPVCLCPKGFKLSNDKYCKDINECEQYGICSQKCRNVAGSYKCECDTDFELQSDNSTCKLTGSDPLLVFSMKTEIRALYLQSQLYFSVVKDEKNVAGVSFDGSHVYWTSIFNGEEAIMRSDKNGSNVEVLVTTGIALPEDLAVDWLTGNIYFTDSEMKHIGVCVNSGKLCAVLVNEDIDSPRSIALLVSKGLMFWTDWGRKPMVARAGMDGSSPVAFVSENIEWPGALTLDVHNERVYWADSKQGIVESIRFDGSDRRSILKEVVKRPFALAVFEDKLYWSDFKNSEIQACNKFTGKNIQKVVYSRHNYIYGMHIYHPTHPENINNPCHDTECSDLCLLAPNSTYSCACPENKILREDRHTCRDVEKHEVLAIGGGNKLVLLTHKAFGKHDISSMDFEHLEKIGALAYHNIDDSIFISDVKRKQISIVNLENYSLKTLVSHGIGTVTSLSYDHLGDNLYWCDSELGTIEVMSMSTLQRTTLWRSFDEIPTKIVTIPEEGVMFVVLEKSHGMNRYHIDKMNMDGLGGIVHFLESSLDGPVVSLTYDSQRHELIITDSGRGSIESCELDGTHHNTILSLSHSPVSVTTLGNDLFWATEESTHLYWSDKMKRFSKVKRISLDMFKEEVLELASLRGTMKAPEHPCRNNNGGCSDVCLVSSNTLMCACPEDHVLRSDNKTCMLPTHCARHQFKCERENKCIPALQRCNGHQDCLTNEDELDCPQPCHLDQFECNNGHCIPIEERCDDIPQCVDGSDEFSCHPVFCQDGDFECFSGECVKAEWRCDLRIDCRDGSDEENCDEVKCPPGKFRCKTGTCIPSTWECDHEANCADGSDEHEGCPPVTCAPEDFMCSNKRCIDAAFRCNDVDECGDNSDEEHCPTLKNVSVMEACSDDEFSCKRDLCLPIAAKCNGSAECPGGEDELGCGCSSGEFECDHKKCIALMWVCDGSFDCIDKSDEDPLLCKNKPNTGPCVGYRCASGQCIDLSQACNGRADCSDGSDEGGSCGTSCSRGNPCDDICNPTPSGPQCSCHPGFSMTAGSTCVDDDECSQNLCAQLCFNSPGSFRCDCSPGYSLRLDRMSCKAEGDPMEVLFLANGNEILLAPFSLQRIKIFHQDLGVTIKSIDVNIPKKLVYWSTGRGGAIFCKSLQDRSIKNVTGLGRPMKIAVDWITDSVYFTDEAVVDHVYIKVCNFKMRKCAKIVSAEDGYQIDNLAVDPISGYIFWTEGMGGSSSHSVIKRSDMSGADTQTLVSGLSSVGGLTTDLTRRWLFWADGKDAIVGAVGYNGEGRHLVVDKDVKLASGLELHEDSLYWIASGLGRLVRHKIFGQQKVSDWVQLNSPNVNDFALIQEQRQREGRDDCLRKHCWHMCVAGATQAQCICPDGTPVEEYTPCLLANTSTIFSDNSSPVQNSHFPIVGTVMILISAFIVLGGLAYACRSRLRFSRSDFSRSVQFITSPYTAFKKATTGSSKLDSKDDEEMEEVLSPNPAASAASAAATTPQGAGSRRTLQVRISDLQSSDEETEFSGKDTARLIP